MRPINKIIIHCAATHEGKDISVDTVKRWHLNKGWSDIGYHYVIELNGSVMEGRPVGLVGAHCKGQNEDSIGICYIGGLDTAGNPKDTRTDAQKESMRKLVSNLLELYPEATVHGHNEFSSKACPCFNVQKQL
jgi:N-acetylmuramoyl-L-alanine amidase